MSLHPQYAIDRISLMHFQLIAASDISNMIVFIGSLREKLILNYFLLIFENIYAKNSLSVPTSLSAE
jgi:hypothetical protein